MTPADAVRIAARVGAIARAAGLKTVEDIQIPEGRIPRGIQQRHLLYRANHDRVTVAVRGKMRTTV
jgi:hypothetical protein